jgi:hypothetical protein
MRIPLPHASTEVSVEIADQTVLAALASRAASELTLRNQTRRPCRLCDPISGQCRHVCVPKPRKFK